MSTIRRANPRKQGEIGLGDAIAWFSANGYSVSIPLADNQPYDLIVDSPEHGLQRVQVKTTTHRGRSGSFAVDLRTNGGNRSRHTSKAFDHSSCEVLYVLTDEGARYVIPTAAFTAVGGLVLGPKYDVHLVGQSDGETPQGTRVASPVRRGG